MLHASGQAAAEPERQAEGLPAPEGSALDRARGVVVRGPRLDWAPLDPVASYGAEPAAPAAPLAAEAAWLDAERTAAHQQEAEQAAPEAATTVVAPIVAIVAPAAAEEQQQDEDDQEKGHRLSF